ncbi:MAG TPA: MFS transporter [Thermoguttaceae bacterium]|nr:MFS transporter [Thermoguttaceae bacterium]
MSDNPRIRLLTLCALYVAQGIPWGFVYYTLAAYLAARGLSLDQWGTVLAMSTLPWALKFVWGPIIDRFTFLPMGRRRPWILLAQVLMAVTIATMIAIPDLVAGVAALSWMVFLHNVFNSLQDVSVDALAVDLLAEGEREKVSGMMFGAKYLGTIIGGFGFGFILEDYDLRTVLIAQVAILLGIMLVPLLVRERAGERLLPWTKGRTMAPAAVRSAASIRRLFMMLVRAFSLRSTLMGAAIALAGYVGVGILGAVTPGFYVNELGWEEKQYTDILGGAGELFGLMGSVAGGFLASRFGARRMAAVATILLGATWIGFSLCEPLWPEKTFVIAFTLATGAFSAVLTVSLFAVFMAISWPLIAATQFTTYMAFMNLSQTFGAKIAGWLDRLLYLDQIYLCAGVFQISLILLLPLIDPRQTRRVLGDGTEHDSSR